MAANHGSECKNDPPQSHVKISKSSPMNSSTPFISTSKGKNSKDSDEDSRTIIRASSVPRPRAVLSSPDNDGMIGNQNQIIRKREAPLKRPNKNLQAHDTERMCGKPNQLTRKSGAPSKSRPSSQNTHAQVAFGQRNARVSAPPRTREVAVESERSTSRKRPVIKGGQQKTRAHEHV